MWYLETIFELPRVLNILKWIAFRDYRMFSNLHKNKRFFRFFQKRMNSQNTGRSSKKKLQIKNQIFENSREFCNFKIHDPDSPSWHDIFKSITMLLTTFDRYKHDYLLTKYEENWRTHFIPLPNIPFIHQSTHQSIHPPIRKLAGTWLVMKILSGPRKGNCRDFATL